MSIKMPDWLRLLTAQEVLEARWEVFALAGEDRELALCSNACLEARTVTKRGRRAYRSGADVLERCSVEEIQALARLCPACRAEAERETYPVCGRETGEVIREENPAFDWARYEKLKEGGEM